MPSRCSPCRPEGECRRRRLRSDGRRRRARVRPTATLAGECEQGRSPDQAMFAPEIVLTAVLNGLLTGSVYALIALGLTLVYGVLHIINFAHGALLTAAMFAVLVVHLGFGIDPYLSILFLTPLF